MSRKKPDIVVPYDSKAKSNDLIQNIFDDMFVTNHTPDSINLDGVIFTLTLSKNVSQKGDFPLISVIFFVVTPGSAISINKKLIPLCFGSLGPVLTSAKIQSALSA